MLFSFTKQCGRWDLNPRTPARRGSEPRAFDLAWQPPLINRLLSIFIRTFHSKEIEKNAGEGT